MYAQMNIKRAWTIADNLNAQQDYYRRGSTTFVPPSILYCNMIKMNENSENRSKYNKIGEWFTSSTGSQWIFRTLAHRVYKCALPRFRKRFPRLTDWQNNRETDLWSCQRRKSRCLLLRNWSIRTKLCLKTLTCHGNIVQLIIDNHESWHDIDNIV